MKKLEEQEKTEQGLPPELKLAAQYDLFSAPQSILNLSQQYLIPENGFAIIYRIGHPIDQPSAVFHPPTPGAVISPA
jgi:hypothetical protein